VQWDHLSQAAKLENWEVFPDSLRYIAGGKVGVMLFRHPCIGMAELSSNDRHWYARHGEIRRVRVPQDVKIHRRRDLGSLTRII
jgi:hypothetical protein